MSLNREQQYALDMMNAGYNVHIYGDAGTGKSYTINEYINNLSAEEYEKTLIIAPTGIAALNLGGSTIHRELRAPTDPISRTEKISTSAIKKLRIANRIIIDEISMCRFDLFSYIARAIEEAEATKDREIQVIVTGDMMQLPPVLTRQDKEMLNELWGFDASEGFPFLLSNMWNAFEFKNIRLTEPMRQAGDIEFCENLNKAKVGDTSCIPWFMEHTAKERPSDAIIICTKNQEATDINNEKMDEIDSAPKSFFADITGDVKTSDRAVPEELKLKVGARVMSVVNRYSERGETLYQNGSMGTVIGFSKELTSEGLIDAVEVEFDLDGYKITRKVLPYSWEIGKYKIVTEKKPFMREETLSDGSKRTVPATRDEKVLRKEVIGVYTQIPLKLAYAMTVHKVQGQTFDKVILNISSCFSPGQLYVALSRCRTASGLYIETPLNKKWLIASKKALEFYAESDAKMRVDMEQFLAKSNCNTDQNIDHEEPESSVSKILDEIVTIHDFLNGNKIDINADFPLLGQRYETASYSVM